MKDKYLLYLRKLFSSYRSVGLFPYESYTSFLANFPNSTFNDWQEAISSMSCKERKNNCV